MKIQMGFKAYNNNPKLSCHDTSCHGMFNVLCYQDMPEDTVINFDEYIGKLYSQDQTKRIKQFRKAHKNICKFLHLH